MAISGLKLHNNYKCRKDWPSYVLITNCTEQCTYVTHFEQGQPQNHDSEPLFKIKCPIKPMLAREHELDIVHQFVNNFQVVQVASLPAIGKTALIKELCFEF